VACAQLLLQQSVAACVSVNDCSADAWSCGSVCVSDGVVRSILGLRYYHSSTVVYSSGTCSSSSSGSAPHLTAHAVALAVCAVFAAAQRAAAPPAVATTCVCTAMCEVEVDSCISCVIAKGNLLVKSSLLCVSKCDRSLHSSLHCSQCSLQCLETAQRDCGHGCRVIFFQFTELQNAVLA
jgi:hypothetical protein